MLLLLIFSQWLKQRCSTNASRLITVSFDASTAATTCIRASILIRTISSAKNHTSYPIQANHTIYAAAVASSLSPCHFLNAKKCKIIFLTFLFHLQLFFSACSNTERNTESRHLLNSKTIYFVDTPILLFILFFIRADAIGCRLWRTDIMEFSEFAQQLCSSCATWVNRKISEITWKIHYVFYFSVHLMPRFLASGVQCCAEYTHANTYMRGTHTHTLRTNTQAGESFSNIRMVCFPFQSAFPHFPRNTEFYFIVCDFLLSCTVSLAKKETHSVYIERTPNVPITFVSVRNVSVRCMCSCICLI